MNDAEQPFLNDTPKNSNGSNGSPDKTDAIVPSPVPQPETSLSKKSSASDKNLLPVLRTKGGNLAEITDNISKEISHGLPQATKDATLKFLERNAYGFVGGLVMTCKGLQCPVLSVCPLYQTQQTLPQGSSCPFEAGIVQTWVNKHLTALGIVDYSAPENSFDMDLLYELAANELIKWKAAQHISKKASLIDDRQVAANMQGDAIFAEVITPALEIIDTHTKITMKIRDALLATRKAQIQAGQDMGDPTKKISDLAARARSKILERVNKNPDKIEDANFTEVKE